MLAVIKLACSVCIFIKSWITESPAQGGITHGVLGLPTLVINKENAGQTCVPTNQTETFSQMSFLEMLLACIDRRNECSMHGTQQYQINAGSCVEVRVGQDMICTSQGMKLTTMTLS